MGTTQRALAAEVICRSQAVREATAATLMASAVSLASSAVTLVTSEALLAAYDAERASCSQHHVEYELSSRALCALDLTVKWALPAALRAQLHENEITTFREVRVFRELRSFKVASAHRGGHSPPAPTDTEIIAELAWDAVEPVHRALLLELEKRQRDTGISNEYGFISTTTPVPPSLHPIPTQLRFVEYATWELGMEPALCEKLVAQMHFVDDEWVPFLA
ncbi:hypothetical protein C8J57DRAFT_1558821 [Mycena rebaudengoi]|nr:hypothetical protein C8J57DRAFT_1558821 [Mycena rebaudengoi]